LPIKKETRPRNWKKREILDGIFYQLKKGCNWEDLPSYLPPYSTVYWYYQQWRSQGVIEELMRVLHSQVREQVKKNRSFPNHYQDSDGNNHPNKALGAIDEIHQPQYAQFP